MKTTFLNVMKQTKLSGISLAFQLSSRCLTELGLTNTDGSQGLREHDSDRPKSTFGSSHKIEIEV